MNYKQFISQELIAKDNHIGIVISFNEEHIVVNFNNQIKTYNTDIALKVGYLTFTNKRLQEEVNKFLKEKTNQEMMDLKEKEHIKQQAISKIKHINQIYQKLKYKNELMLILFGNDFFYPPYHHFVMKYKRLISHRKYYVTSY